MVMVGVDIVGAGPAGLATALEIVQRNTREQVWWLNQAMPCAVTVYDEKEKIGEPQRCAGGVGLWMAGRVGFEPPPNTIVANVRRVTIYAPNGKYWEMKGMNYGYVLDRTKLEQIWAEQVQNLGGLIIQKRIVKEDIACSVHVGNVVVGADGPNSVVRQFLTQQDYLYLQNKQLQPLGQDMHIGVQKTIMMDYYPQDLIEVYFGEKVAPKGYAWIFPCGNGMVRIGLGVPVELGSQAGALLERFIARHVVEYEAKCSIAKQIPTARMPKKGVYGNVVLVGDALPATDPLTGGGICQAIMTGKAAAEAIVYGDLECYDSLIAWLRKENHRRYRMKTVICSLKDQDFNDLIETMRSFHLKSSSIGKELRRGVVHLIRKKPRLIGKFFKAL